MFHPDLEDTVTSCMPIPKPNECYSKALTCDDFRVTVIIPIIIIIIIIIYSLKIGAGLQG